MRRRLRAIAIRLIALGLVLIGVAAAVAIVELGAWGLLRLKGKTAEPFAARYQVGQGSINVPYVGYRYPPLAENVREGLGTDRHGFIHNGNRDRDLSTKAPGVFRIFILGGSTVAGDGRPEDTISARLERALNAAGGPRRFEVVNAGVSAWLSSQDLAMMAFYLPEFQPDLVISVTGFTDVYYAIRSPREAWHPSINQHLINQARAAYVHERDIAGTLRQALGMLADRSYVMDVVSEAGASLRSRRTPPPSPAPAPLRSDPLDAYRRNLRLMASVARTLDTGLLAVLEPTVLRSNSDGKPYRAPILAEVSSSWSAIDFWAEKETLYGEARGIFARLSTEAPAPAVQFRDYSALLDDEREPSYSDQAHFTAAGNAAMAEALERDVRQLVHFLDRPR